MLITRRDAIRGGLFGAAGLLSGGRLASPARAALPPRGASPGGLVDDRTASVSPAPAKAVIQIWMWGGPSHLDTFDPKPDAGYDYCGPLDKPIPTNVDGIIIGELLPLLAKQADKYSIIRSMTHGINAHETAAYWVQTGRKPGERLVFPGVGAVVSLFKGYNAGYRGLIPPYIVVTDLQGRFSESGFLGPRYAPFATGGDPQQTPFAVQGVITPGMTDAAAAGSARPAASAEHARKRAARPTRRCRRSTRAEDQAYELILGDAGKVFDLTQETGRGQGAVRPQHVRAVVPGRTPARRARRALRHDQLEGVGHPQAALPDDAAAAAADGSGPGDAAAGPVGPRPARQHDCLVERRVRPDAEGPVGAALERRARSLRRASSRPWWPAAGSRAAAWSARPTREGSRSRTARSTRPTSSAASTICSASISTAKLPNPDGLDVRLLPPASDNAGGDRRLTEIMPDRERLP